MLAAQEVARLPGVEDAAIVMATEANKGILKEAGLLMPQTLNATANDLVIAIRTAQDNPDELLAQADKFLHRKETAEKAGDFRPRTLHSALRSNPAANVAVISVSGRYAAQEAWNALKSGLHVLLFSDNVSLEDEIALKRFANQQGLLMMGPGAGTAIINGVALGFANQLAAGPAGIVSAAGTGLQEVSTQLARYGVGITQGIGTGGRDLKEDVGGMMMLAGLGALQADPATRVIVLVSKPPAPSVMHSVLEQVYAHPKPAVVCLLGGEFISQSANVLPAHTLEEAAWLAASLVKGEKLADPAAQPDPRIAALRQRLKPPQRYLRGLFSGGTLCYEAQVIWEDFRQRGRLTPAVFSNAPLHQQRQMSDSTLSQGHCAVDLGEEEFTVGRLHPMIDNSLRIRRFLQESRDPETAVIMLDVVLGFGAHPDPAAELGPVVLRARAQAAEEGRELLVVASITGTEQDPQGLSRQAQALEGAGVILCASNAAAARLAAELVSDEHE